MSNQPHDQRRTRGRHQQPPAAPVPTPIPATQRPGPQPRPRAEGPGYEAASPGRRAAVVAHAEPR